MTVYTKVKFMNRVICKVTSGKIKYNIYCRKVIGGNLEICMV